MADWSKLQLDVTIMIAEKLEFYEDFKVFGCVCTWWEKAMKLSREPTASRKTPLLMTVDPPRSSTRQFYGLNKRMALEAKLPIPSTTRGGANNNNMGLRHLFSVDEEEASDWRYFSSRGWLICVTQIGFNVILVHPLSGKIIQPPAVPETVMISYNAFWDDFLYLMMFSKFALSECPTATSDYMIGMLFPTYNNLALWRSGDEEWTVLDNDAFYGQFLDITFYNGEFYAVDQNGKILTLGKSSPPTPRLIANFQFRFTFPGSLYLVESGGKLLLVSRKVSLNEDDERLFYRTLYFEVWEVNVDNGETNKVTHLSDRALFVGCNSSFSMEAFPLQGCKPNCIYYTDNISDNRYVCDVGVYDFIAGQKVDDLYYESFSYISSSPCPSPLWVERPLNSVYVRSISTSGF